DRTGGSAGIIANPSRATYILVFGLFGLAIYQSPPNSTMQGQKSGDFLNGVLKKYYSTLAWWKATYIDIERELV
ncbi:hypothetical protein, partial [Bacillus cereus]|uniref:hypothetical protein n=1 Tax=Bacillus cereus TaxID=1396 RepID=UPI0020D208E3